MQKIIFIAPSYLEYYKYKLVILSILGLPGYAHQKQYHFRNSNRKLWCLSVNKKITYSLNFFITLQRILQSDWSKTFWAITPEQEFSQISGCDGNSRIKKLSFCVIFRKKKWQNFQKILKYPIFGPFLPLHKNWALSRFSIQN